MPTGYTAAIEKGISFEQFVWSCARGMGALIMMRDSAHDAPIPEAFKPSTYNAEALAAANARVAELQAMTSDVAEDSAANAYDAELASHTKILADKAALRSKYEAMQERVSAWVPPTGEHRGLRSFMLEQLSESIKFDCSVTHYPTPKKLTGAEWLARELGTTVRAVEYHREEVAKEIERTDGRNAWIAALRQSVPPPPQAA